MDIDLAQPLPRIDSIEDASRWIDILHRRSVRDAETHVELFDRIAWLAAPWRRRAFQRPPWLRRQSAPTITTEQPVEIIPENMPEADELTIEAVAERIDNELAQARLFERAGSSLWEGAQLAEASDLVVQATALALRADGESLRHRRNAEALYHRHFFQPFDEAAWRARRVDERRLAAGS